MKLNEQLATIEEICNRALKEYSLRKDLDLMKKQWPTVEFKT